MPTGRLSKLNPFVTRDNLFVLHSMGEAYGVRPSEILGMETPWGAWQVDRVTLIVGRKVEKEIIDGKPPESSPAASTEEFRDPRGLAKVKKIKRNPDGTW